MNSIAGTLLPTGRFVGRTAREQLLPRMRLVETAYLAGQVLPRHAHERAHLCFVLDGSYTETVDAATRRRDALSVMYLPGGVPHEERHHSSGRHFLMELTGSIPELFGDGTVSREAIAVEANGAILAARLYAAFRAEEGIDGAAADVAWELIALCGRPHRSDHPRWVDRTRDSIRERYRLPLRLETLAAEAAVHPVHLAQTFRRVHGSTVGQFIRQLRVEHACAALLRGRMSLSEIAHDAGFADQSHLTRCFRATMAMTPGQYRALVGVDATPKGVQDRD